MKKYSDLNISKAQIGNSFDFPLSVKAIKTPVEFGCGGSVRIS